MPTYQSTSDKLITNLLDIVLPIPTNYRAHPYQCPSRAFSFLSSSNQFNPRVYTKPPASLFHCRRTSGEAARRLNPFPPARLPSRHFVIYYRGRFGACVSIILIYTKQSRERRRRSNDNEGEREECAATAPASINSQPQRQRSDAPPFFPFVLVKRSRDFSERPRKSAERREGRNRLITLHVEGERERERRGGASIKGG